MADFSFPTLPPPSSTPTKPMQPLTAQSTVRHAGGASEDGPSTSKPVLPIKEVKPAGRRNKVPLEKGFSQVDWLKLAKSGRDMRAGLGLRKDISWEEVRQHSAPDDAWMVLSGRVYNITHYMPFHPGGAQILMQAAGKDGTGLFQRYHPWVNGHALLESCLLGAVKTASGGKSPLSNSSSGGSEATTGLEQS